uniref:transposase n=1 Tax=Streptomyces rhizosphaericus TaxID=114699 RepID=UPI002030CBA8|nr:transposase [Streptomyces rhizosphaericus]
MEPQSWPEPAPEVAPAVRAKYRGRQVPLPVVVRDRLGELFADAEFAEAFAVTGPRGWSPGRLALVTVLQMAENLTDRQAAEAVRDKLSWSYALGLGLEDPGFDFRVLSQFRTRVAAHGLEEKVLDLLVARLVEQDLLAAGGKQRTDSTHVIAAVRDLNRLELTGEAVRAALEALTCAEPDWVAQAVDVTSWSKRYGPRVDSWRLPTPGPSSRNWPWTSPGTASPCWARSTTPAPRSGCASSAGADKSSTQFGSLITDLRFSSTFAQVPSPAKGRGGIKI